MKTKGLISVQVPEEMKEELTAKAKAEDVTLSQFCRRILKQHIAAATPPPGAESTPAREAAAA